VFTDRTPVSWFLCLLSLVSLASCFGKPIKIKGSDAAVAGQQSDGRGAGGEAGPGDGPGPVADSKIATDGLSSNGGAGGNSGTGGSNVGLGGSGGSAGGSSVAGDNGGADGGGSTNVGDVAGIAGGGSTAIGGISTSGAVGGSGGVAQTGGSTGMGGSGRGGSTTADAGDDGKPDAPSPVVDGAGPDVSSVGVDGPVDSATRDSLTAMGPDLAPDVGPDLAPDLPTLKALGASCSVGSECSKGFCAGGVCCDRSCTGACEKCSAATNGLCTYTKGTVCSAGTECLSAAVCSDSSGSCPAPVPKSTTTLCGTAPTCAGNTQSASYCDGAGNCGLRTNKACGLYTCVSGTGCRTSCTTNADCISSTSAFCGPSGTCTTNSACWRDITTNLLWQRDSDPNYHHPADAQTYCSGLTLCGFSDWYVPDIDQLRTLISWCPANQTGGACGVTDSCLLDSCGDNCIDCDYMAGQGTDGCYQTPELTGPCAAYWSSSSYTSYLYGYATTRYRVAGFTGGGVGAADPTDSSYVRCIR